MDARISVPHEAINMGIVFSIDTITFGMPAENYCNSQCLAKTSRIKKYGRPISKFSWFVRPYFQMPVHTFICLSLPSDACPRFQMPVCTSRCLPILSDACLYFKMPAHTFRCLSILEDACVYFEFIMLIVPTSVVILP